MDFTPAAVDIVAVNYDVVRNLVEKSSLDYTGSNAMATIKDFDRLVKNRVDEQDSKYASSDALNDDLLHRCSPYLRFSEFNDTFSSVVFATPQILEVSPHTNLHLKNCLKLQRISIPSLPMVLR